MCDSKNRINIVATVVVLIFATNSFASTEINFIQTGTVAGSTTTAGRLLGPGFVGSSTSSSCTNTSPIHVAFSSSEYFTNFVVMVPQGMNTTTLTIEIKECCTLANCQGGGSGTLTHIANSTAYAATVAVGAYENTPLGNSNSLTANCAYYAVITSAPSTTNSQISIQAEVRTP